MFASRGTCINSNPCPFLVGDFPTTPLPAAVFGSCHDSITSWVSLMAEASGTALYLGKQPILKALSPATRSSRPSSSSWFQASQGAGYARSSTASARAVASLAGTSMVLAAGRRYRRRCPAVKVAALSLSEVEEKWSQIESLGNTEEMAGNCALLCCVQRQLGYMAAFHEGNVGAARVVSQLTWKARKALEDLTMKYGSTVKSLKLHCKPLVDASIYRQRLLLHNVELPDSEPLETLSKDFELQLLLLPFQEEDPALERALDALEDAVQEGKTQEVEKVLRIPIHPDPPAHLMEKDWRLKKNFKGAQPWRSALYAGVCAEEIECIRMLLDAGANPSQRGALGEAVFTRNREIASLLLQAKADPEGITYVWHEHCKPLRIAVTNADVTMVEFLLQNGCQKDAVDRKGATALLHACRLGHAQVIDVLLRSGASVNQAAEDGQTPLLAASRENKVVIVQSLLKYGAEINARDSANRTALWLAAERNFIVMAEYLLKSRAEVDTLDIRKRSALWEAASEGHFEIATMLLERGAQQDLTNTEGLTPVDITRKNKRRRLVSLFRKHEISVIKVIKRPASKSSPKSSPKSNPTVMKKENKKKKKNKNKGFLGWSGLGGAPALPLALSWEGAGQVYGTSFAGTADCTLLEHLLDCVERADKDHRFPTPAPADVKDIVAQVSLLRSFADISDSPLDWTPGVHGIWYSDGQQPQLVYLPQAVEELCRDDPDNAVQRILSMVQRRASPDAEEEEFSLPEGHVLYRFETTSGECPISTLPLLQTRTIVDEHIRQLLFLKAARLKLNGAVAGSDTPRFALLSGTEKQLGRAMIVPTEGAYGNFEELFDAELRRDLPKGLRQVRRIFVISPVWDCFIDGCGIPEQRCAWYGNFALDIPLLEELRSSKAFQVLTVDQDQRERSIEALLPFVRSCVAQDQKFTLVPILVGGLMTEKAQGPWMVV
eukprot:s458_g15.t1